MSIMTQNQTKLFNFMIAVEEGRDTPELYAEIKNSYDDEHYAISIMDALMRKYHDDAKKFASAYSQCGLDVFMAVGYASGSLALCEESLTVKAENRTAVSKFYEKVLDFADTVDNANFKVSIYSMMASRMLNGLMISENLEMAKRINAFLADKDTTAANLPSYIMTTIGRV